MPKTLHALFLTAALLAAGPAAAAPKVVASIKPVHSLVAAIMEGIGEPGLIVEGAASPHTYALKPSNAAALQEADLVFWVGHGLEAFLERPLETLGARATAVELEDAPGLEKLPLREGGPFEAHAHEGHDHEEGHGAFDMHLWLDPGNARAMAAEIAARLAEKDPAHAEAYQANLAKLEGRLDALDREIAGILAPVKERPFVVFHDAYQYFEHRYGLHAAGSITVSPETPPGAERLSEIRVTVKRLGATCVFAEPQFEPKLIKVVIEGTPAKSGTLDPEAATYDAGPGLYFELMRGLATSLRDCLG